MRLIQLACVKLVTPLDCTVEVLITHNFSSKQQNFQLAHCPCQPAWAINLTMQKEEVIEKEEQVVIEEYDSDFDSNLSSPQLSENEEMESDDVVPSTLKTRNGRQIKEVVRLDL